MITVTGETSTAWDIVCMTLKEYTTHETATLVSHVKLNHCHVYSYVIIHSSEGQEYCGAALSCLVGFWGFHPYMCLFSIENFFVIVKLCSLQYQTYATNALHFVCNHVADVLLPDQCVWLLQCSYVDTTNVFVSQDALSTNFFLVYGMSHTQLGELMSGSCIHVGIAITPHHMFFIHALGKLHSYVFAVQPNT